MKVSHVSLICRKESVKETGVAFHAQDCTGTLHLAI